jgi:drug/metabolite transporter (DMT)-like permease
MVERSDSAAPAAGLGSQALAGSLVLCAGIAVFSLQDIIFKIVSSSYSVSQAVFIRSLVALPLALVLVAVESGLPALRLRRPGLVYLRGGLLFLAYLSFYLGIAALPIANNVAIAMSGPLFITIFGALLLGDRVGPRRIAAVIVGFAGVLLVVRPGTQVFEPASLLPLGCALSYAMAQIISRKLGDTTSSSVMSFHAMLVYLAAAALLGLATGDGRFLAFEHPTLGFLLRAWRWPDIEGWALMSATAVVSTIGFYCLSQAYRIAEPQVVAPFEYTAMLWGLLWGYVVWRNVPDGASLAGIALIIGSGLYILYRESRQRSGR